MGALTLVSPRNESDAVFGRKLWDWVKARKPKATFDLTTTHVKVRFGFAGEADLQLGLDCLTAWNVAQCRRQQLPWIYDSGIRYEREILCNHDGLIGICEEWWTTLELLKRGSGDCEDLGCTTAAMRIVYNKEHARAFAKRSSVGWHIQVRRADGSIEDPSALLGMNGDG